MKVNEKNERSPRRSMSANTVYSKNYDIDVVKTSLRSPRNQCAVVYEILKFCKRVENRRTLHSQLQCVGLFHPADRPLEPGLGPFDRNYPRFSMRRGRLAFLETSENSSIDVCRSRTCWAKKGGFRLRWRRYSGQRAEENCWYN